MSSPAPFFILNCLTAFTQQNSTLTDALQHCIEYVVLKKDGTFKTGPFSAGATPRQWRFTPANRRIVFEVDVPAKEVSMLHTQYVLTQ
jgi:hypothetical protein